MQLIHVKAVPCVISRRVSRFMVEVFTGRAELAYLSNTGRLEQYLVKGRRGYCLRSPGGKTSLRLIAVEDMGLAAVVDTRLQMRAFEKAAGLSLIPWMRGCRIAGRDVVLGSSKIDYLLECEGGAVYLEAKSAVMRKGAYALYPDCPTPRGRRHIKELTSHARAGGRSILLFIAAVPHAEAFKPNRGADPKLYELLSEAAEAGVALRAIGVHYNPLDSCIHLYSPDLSVNLAT
ncbi:MAG: DNA/RNA nuclease SfsA [Thermoproteota archaeon]|nr:MAG: DNA/RNA nuclease SfsA [Candidatus Korarchaeota archaeon]RLG51827.1 MAG: DNA/RNA nuclease SfsA [Candidatus Korarchaeota archaeon]